MAKAKPVPDGFSTITAILTLDDCKGAIDWYKKALGAESIDVNTGADGKVMHALLKVGNARLMMNDALFGKKGPKALGGSPASLWLYVDDCDAAFKKALAAGAKQTMPMGDQFWGDRMGQIADPYGYEWSIATHKEDLSKEEIAKRQAAFFKNFAGGPPKK